MSPPRRVLVAGGTGMLGRPVVRRLLEDGFSVRVLARSPQKARSLLPGAVEVASGDLARPQTLEEACRDCSALYVSVDTPPGPGFHPETEGLRNLAEAAKRSGKPRLVILSALGSSDPANAEHRWWHAREKHLAQRIARESGLPWTILEPTWLMESLPLFVRGKTFYWFSDASLSAHWIAGDDLGRLLSAALIKGSGQGEVIAVQGPKKLTMLEAASAFIEAYDPSIQVKTVPLWTFRVLGLFKSEAKELVSLLDCYSGLDEPAPAESVWRRFARPRMEIADYARYCRRTGDFPQKG